MYYKLWIMTGPETYCGVILRPCVHPNETLYAHNVTEKVFEEEQACILPHGTSRKILLSQIFSMSHHSLHHSQQFMIRSNRLTGRQSLKAWRVAAFQKTHT